MKITRMIRRVIEVSPAEIYAALAVKYDLPPNPNHISVDGSTGNIEIEAQETVEQEIEE